MRRPLPGLAVLLTLVVSASIACERDGALPNGSLWARNESGSALLVRQSSLTLGAGEPDISYVWRIDGQSDWLVSPGGANNSLIEVLEPGSCRVIGRQESHDDQLAVLVQPDGVVSFSTDRGVDVDQMPQAGPLTECGGEPPP